MASYGTLVLVFASFSSN